MACSRKPKLWLPPLEFRLLYFLLYNYDFTFIILFSILITIIIEAWTKFSIMWTVYIILGQWVYQISLQYWLYIIILKNNWCSIFFIIFMTLEPDLAYSVLKFVGNSMHLVPTVLQQPTPHSCLPIDFS